MPAVVQPAIACALRQAISALRCAIDPRQIMALRVLEVRFIMLGNEISQRLGQGTEPV
ncbi:MAG: hypothetical protein WAV02_10180 [Stellaceae bacterium]